MSKKIEYKIDYEKLRDDLNYKMNIIRHSSSYDIPEYLFANQMKVGHTTLFDILDNKNKRSLFTETLFKLCEWLGEHPSKYIKNVKK